MTKPGDVRRVRYAAAGSAAAEMDANQGLWLLLERVALDARDEKHWLFLVLTPDSHDERERAGQTRLLSELWVDEFTRGWDEA